MDKAQFDLLPVQPYRFESTVRSHGWASLAPFAWNAKATALERVLRLTTGQVVLMTMSGGPDGAVRVAAQHAQLLGAIERDELERTAVRMLRTDEDLAGFFDVCEERGGVWRQAVVRATRLLRSATLWEDMVKIIATTNVQWGGARGMVRRLVEAYGEPLAWDPERRAFPTPQAVAAIAEDAFGATVRMGYRTAYVCELAARIVEGDLDLAALEDPDLPTKELRQRLLAIKGVGAYAAAHLLMLLGRYDDIPVDTAFRSYVGERYFAGEKASDKVMVAVYDDWGPWRGWAYWHELLWAFQSPEDSATG